MEKREKTWPVDRKFVAARAISGSESLVPWLRNQRDPAGKPLRVRIPVLLRLTRPDSSVSDSWIGPEEGRDPIRVTDSALGIPLAERVRQACPESRVCLLWLEGFWNDQADPAGEFRVVRVHGRVEARPGVPLQAEIEVP